jgi:hypothetical protein
VISNIRDVAWIAKGKQDRQCTYNIIPRRVGGSLLPCNCNKYQLLVCVCVRACVYVGTGRVGVCMHISAHIALLIQHATSMRHVVTSFVAPWSPLYFSTSHKRCDFRKKKKVVERKMCVLIFCTNFV